MSQPDPYLAERKALVDDYLARYRALADEYLAAVAECDDRYLPRLRGAHAEMMEELAALDRRWLASGKVERHV